MFSKSNISPVDIIFKPTVAYDVARSNAFLLLLLLCLGYCTGSLFCGGVSSLVIRGRDNWVFYHSCRVAVYVGVSSPWCLGLSPVCVVAYPGYT